MLWYGLVFGLGLKFCGFNALCILIWVLFNPEPTPCTGLCTIFCAILMEGEFCSTCFGEWLNPGNCSPFWCDLLNILIGGFGEFEFILTCEFSGLSPVLESAGLSLSFLLRMLM